MYTTPVLFLNITNLAFAGQMVKSEAMPGTIDKTETMEMHPISKSWLDT